MRSVVEGAHPAVGELPTQTRPMLRPPARLDGAEECCSRERPLREYADSTYFTSLRRRSSPSKRPAPERARVPGDSACSGRAIARHRRFTRKATVNYGAQPAAPPTPNPANDVKDPPPQAAAPQVTTHFVVGKPGLVRQL
jgi:hypothetical protein